LILKGQHILRMPFSRLHFMNSSVLIWVALKARPALPFGRGRNILAEGEALGLSMQIQFIALKGRNKLAQ